MKGVLCIAILIGVATPVGTWAGAGGTQRAHSVPVPQRSFAIETRAQSGHERQKFAGFGESGAYSTLLSGTFPIVPPDADEGTNEPPPYPPPYYIVQYTPPPHRCVRPLLIHIAPPSIAKNLPRLVYGTPLDCPG